MTGIALWVDTDNALGSGRGDIDDGFALAYLLARHESLPSLITTIFGNTSKELAFRNSAKLLTDFGRSIRLYSGASAPGDQVSSQMLDALRAESEWRVLALGPLTNIGAVLQKEPDLATQIKECVIVATNSSSWGRWPPYYPMEFNATQDLRAFRKVWESRIPITILPLNVARQLSFYPGDIAKFPANLRSIFEAEVQRWVRRCILLRGRGHFPVWDLGAAVYIFRPDFFELESTFAELQSNGLVRYGRGDRGVRVVSSIDTAAVWKEFWRCVGGDL